MPLLLDLLNEPLQVVIKHIPTDWDAVKHASQMNMLGAAAGSLIGALSGALLSYVFTRKTLNDNAKLQRWERIYLEIYSYRQGLNKLKTDLSLILQNTSTDKSLQQKLMSGLIESRDTERNIAGLLHISLPEYDSDISFFQNKCAEFEISISALVKNILKSGEPLDLEACKDSMSKLDNIQGAIGAISIKLAKRIRKKR
ncbi:hypothetical protein ACU6TU_08330 [Halomonas sp. LS-001]